MPKLNEAPINKTFPVREALYQVHQKSDRVTKIEINNFLIEVYFYQVI